MELDVENLWCEDRVGNAICASESKLLTGGSGEKEVYAIFCGYAKRCLAEPLRASALGPKLFIRKSLLSKNLHLSTLSGSIDVGTAIESPGQL